MNPQVLNLERTGVGVGIPDDVIVIKNITTIRGVSRIFIIGFPTSGVGRYFNRGGEAKSDTQTLAT